MSKPRPAPPLDAASRERLRNATPTATYRARSNDRIGINGDVCLACSQIRESQMARHWCDQKVAEDDGKSFPFQCLCPGLHYH